jgi:MerR family transcriptional regulator/heat shock protein HspR
MSDIDVSKEEPVYSISSAARMLHISVHTLRMYEREGLIIPFKKQSKQRLYSKIDIERIECIRRAINEAKISINGIRAIYSLIPCWDIVKCSEVERNACDSFNEHMKPCWSYAHDNNTCEDRSCRDCDVYKKYSQCGEIKEFIKAVSLR